MPNWISTGISARRLLAAAMELSSLSSIWEEELFPSAESWVQYQFNNPNALQKNRYRHDHHHHKSVMVAFPVQQNMPASLSSFPNVVFCWRCWRGSRILSNKGSPPTIVELESILERLCFACFWQTRKHTIVSYCFNVLGRPCIPCLSHKCLVESVLLMALRIILCYRML